MSSFKKSLKDFKARYRKLKKRKNKDGKYLDEVLRLKN